MTTKGDILISGASFAGLASAFWMKQLGYNVTVVEIADGLRRGGTPVDIKDKTVEIMKRMGLFKQILLNRLPLKSTEIVNVNSVATSSTYSQHESVPAYEQEYEIERDVLLKLIFYSVQNHVEFIFGDSITHIAQMPNNLEVSFRNSPRRSFHLVFGCDGIHSNVRNLCFGVEKQFSYFLGAYGSVSIVNKLLIPPNTTQFYNEPRRAVILSAYNGKTDIILIFSSDSEIPYDYRDDEQKQNIVIEKFSSVGWRTPELLEEVKQADNFYFDVLSQIRMPSWTRGRVALVGDAAYCASPAAGRGGSLAIDGAAALADAFIKCGDDHNAAFHEYNESFRAFIEEVQADVVNFGMEFIIPKTAEAIEKRNAGLAASPA